MSHEEVWARLGRAGLGRDILKDPAKRARAIDEYNAKVGGLRGLMKNGRLELAATHEIPTDVSPQDTVRYLRFAAQGKRLPIIFAAGRATRMNLPPEYDELGLAGLTPKILARLANIPVPDKVSDLSFIQRHILQFRTQVEILFKKNQESGAKFDMWLHHAKFAVVANEENKSALARQLAAVHFAGLKPEHVYVIVQPETGGMEILGDGSVKDYKKEVWPEGHGKPFIDMQADPNAAFRLDAQGNLNPLHKTFVEEVSEAGVERAVFAQVNDLHLLEDMAHVTRWTAADALIEKGADMVMEVVENGLKQKGGGIFLGKKGTVVMRDTLAMKSPDLESYSVPRSLSRMFYELTVRGISKLTAQTLPAYLTERKTSDGKSVLTREFYSGDASSELSGQAIQQKGYALETFKMQSRIPVALEWMRRQDSQPGFNQIKS